MRFALDGNQFLHRVPAPPYLPAEVNRTILLDRKLRRRLVLLDCAEQCCSAEGVRASGIARPRRHYAVGRAPARDAMQAELPLQCTTRRLCPQVVIVHARLASILSHQRDDDVDVVAPRRRAAVPDRDPPALRPPVGDPGKPKPLNEPLRQLTPPPVLLHLLFRGEQSARGVERRGRLMAIAAASGGRLADVFFADSGARAEARSIVALHRRVLVWHRCASIRTRFRSESELPAEEGPGTG
jgi:hypothetical protein